MYVCMNGYLIALRRFAGGGGGYVVGPMYVCMYGYLIASRRFLHIEAISRQKEARSRDYALPLFRMTLMVLHSAQYHG